MQYWYLFKIIIDFYFADLNCDSKFMQVHTQLNLKRIDSRVDKKSGFLFFSQ